jgi:hypothetical protein
VKNNIDKRAVIIKSISLIVYAFIFILSFYVTLKAFTYHFLYFLLAVLGIILLIYFYKKPFWGLTTLVIVLPFHAFLWMAIRNHFMLNIDWAFWIAFWKEALIILLLLAVIIKALVKRKFLFKLITLDWLIITLAVLGILSAIFITKNFNQALWGLRTDFEFFVTYFLARSIIKNKEQFKYLIIAILGSGLLVAVFGILQTFFLPRDFLFRFGYTFKPWAPNGPLQAYQTVGSLTRIISFFSGAIQLGPYLAILILLALSLLIYVKSKIIKVILGLFSIFCLTPLYYTYTRSAWLGLTVSLFVLILIFIQQKLKKADISKKKIISLILILIFVVGLISGLFYLLKSGNPGGGSYFDELIHHKASTLEHWQSIKNSLQTIKENPFGIGLGRSGLVTLRFGGRTLSENWYLQIAEEMGILALGIFIAIMVIFIRSLYKLYISEKDNLIKGLSLGVLLSFICFSVVGLFLHAWGDNIVMALTFWILAGGLIEYQALKSTK